MTQTQTTADVGEILNDDFDDALLLAMDNAQLPLPQQQNQNQPRPQEQHGENHNENDSFSALDENVFLQIDELLTSGRPVSNAVPVFTTSVDVAATVHSDTHNADRLSPIHINMPQQNESICDENYSFKIR